MVYQFNMESKDTSPLADIPATGALPAYLRIAELVSRQIDAGMGFSELTAFTAETWGCSRRNACDVVCAAHKDWLDAAYGSEEIDQKDLLF